MPRDYQRSKVYRAEAVAFGCRVAAEEPDRHTPGRCWLDGDCEPATADLPGTVDAAQGWLDLLSRSATFRRLAKWPTAWAGDKPLVDRLMIDPDYRGRTTSRGGTRLVTHRGRYYHAVHIAPNHLRYSHILLHEACHVATWFRECGAVGDGGGHGPAFTGCMVAAARWAYGVDTADRLMASFIDQGCDVNSTMARTR